MARVRYVNFGFNISTYSICLQIYLSYHNENYFSNLSLCKFNAD